jgi:hypothetical protein
MKKVIRLTESDLIKIVKRVINETAETDCNINCMPGPGNDARRIAQRSCCKTRNKNSKECVDYISKYETELKSCKSISFIS